MSHAHDHDPTVPRGALIGVAILLAGTLMFTGAVSYGLIPHSANPEASRAAAHVGIAQQRALLVADQADGSVAIRDAATGRIVTIVPYGEQGFVRATLRRLARAREARGLGAATPFTLRRWDNGALSLHDPATGSNAEIYGFGGDHVRAFASMLEGPAA
jgi:putative photosynthetic complex assembly protein